MCCADAPDRRPLSLHEYSVAHRTIVESTRLERADRVRTCDSALCTLALNRRKAVTERNIDGDAYAAFYVKAVAVWLGVLHTWSSKGIVHFGHRAPNRFTLLSGTLLSGPGGHGS